MAVKKSQPKTKTAAEKLRENRIEAFRMKISQDEETIAEMDSCRNELFNADIKGLAVAHKTFGTGTVIGQESSAITVSFGTQSKRFVMPSAFIDGFLRTEDELFNGIIEKYKVMCEKTLAAKREISEMNRSIEILEKK